MTANQLMTAGAVAFAGFALYSFTKRPGGQLAAQPGQAARDSALQGFMDQTSWQFGQMDGGRGYNWSADIRKIIGA